MQQSSEPINYFHTMAQYNGWMNRRLFSACATLTDEQRKRDCGAFFKSIHGTLNHILLGDRIWLARFAGKLYSFTSLDQELYAEFGELRFAREEVDGEIDRWVADLTESRLREDMVYISAATRRERRHPLWIGAMQIFNHQTHHRGHVTTLLNQFHVDMGVTDLIWLPEHTSNP